MPQNGIYHEGISALAEAFGQNHRMEVCPFIRLLCDLFFCWVGSWPCMFELLCMCVCLLCAWFPSSGYKFVWQHLCRGRFGVHGQCATQPSTDKSPQLWRLSGPQRRCKSHSQGHPRRAAITGGKVIPGWCVSGWRVLVCLSGVVVCVLFSKGGIWGR